MAPVVVTEDYYLVLKVDQSATTETICKSYKKLAFLLHPDRNRQPDATEAFQLLGTAYETLKDESKRRTYDRIYPQIKSKPAQTKTTPQPAPQTKPKQEEDVSEETARIAAIDKAKAERATKWSKTRKVYDDKIFELQREIRKLQGAIKELEEKEKKERDEEAAAKGWGRWLLSPIYGKPVETEEEREGKKRERIGRMHGLRIKEMELGRKDEELAKWEGRLGEGEREFVSGNERDGRDKGVFEERIRVKRERVQRENERVEREAREKARRERMEKERVEQEARQRAWRAQLEKVRIEREARERTVREKQDKERRERKEREKALREQQEKENRELLEKVAARRRKWEEEEATRNEELEERLERAREKMQEDAERRRSRGSHVDEWLRGTSTSFGRAGSRAQGHSEPYSGFASTTRSNCIHEGWWDKVDGRMACEKCGVSRYSYLLQCPGCQFKACASCQQVLRPPRRNMNRMRTDQARHRREAKTTRFGFSHEWDYD